MHDNWAKITRETQPSDGVWGYYKLIAPQKQSEGNKNLRKLPYF